MLSNSSVFHYSKGYGFTASPPNTTTYTPQWPFKRNIWCLLFLLITTYKWAVHEAGGGTHVPINLQQQLGNHWHLTSQETMYLLCPPTSDALTTELQSISFDIKDWMHAEKIMQWMCIPPRDDKYASSSVVHVTLDVLVFLYAWANVYQCHTACAAVLM